MLGLSGLYMSIQVVYESVGLVISKLQLIHNPTQNIYNVFSCYCTTNQLHNTQTHDIQMHPKFKVQLLLVPSIAI